MGLPMRILFWLFLGLGFGERRDLAAASHVLDQGTPQPGISLLQQATLKKLDRKLTRFLAGVLEEAFSSVYSVTLRLKKGVSGEPLAPYGSKPLKHTEGQGTVYLLTLKDVVWMGKLPAVVWVDMAPMADSIGLDPSP